MRSPRPAASNIAWARKAALELPKPGAASVWKLEKALFEGVLLTPSSVASVWLKWPTPPPNHF
jgi:hypothetical protein